MIRFNQNGTVKSDSFKVALSTVTQDSTFQLTGVQLNHVMGEDGKMTSSVKDVTYTVFVPELLSQIKIKVDSVTPVITPEKLDAAIDAGTDVFVEIPVEETFVRPYKIEYGQTYVSIRAPYVELVDN